MRVKTVIILVLLIFLSTGCIKKIAPVDLDSCRKSLPFIKDGETTREEVVQMMGIAPFRYMNDRIFIYYMIIDDENGTLKVNGVMAEYNLVLVFSDDDILTRHSVVKVK